MPVTLDDLASRHERTLHEALEAIQTRGYFSAYPESPSPRVYGETAAADGEARYRAWLGADFPLDTPGAEGRVATERSPYGPELGVRYPHVGPTVTALSALLGSAGRAMAGWREAGTAARSAVCLEILARLHDRVFELANAVQHTSGQAFVMAFQAGGAHALDRALEAVAYAHRPRGADQDTADRVLGEAGRKGRATADDQDVPRGATWCGSRHRMQHVPDMELLARLVRVAGDRQCRRRQATS